MFGWLKRLWNRKSGFTKREREIFSFWDGSAKRWLDPFEIQRDLEKHGGKDWMLLLKGLSVGGGVGLDKMEPPVRQSAVDNYHQSVRQVADLVRLAFHVAPVSTFRSGRNSILVGLTDNECLKLLASYLEFLSELETEFRPLLLPPMEPAEPSEEDSITEPSLDSPVIETACDVTEPKTSPEESPLPSVACGA